MKHWLIRGLKSLGVLTGIILLTSLTIDATDSLNDSNSALSLLALRVVESECPDNMIKIDFAEKSICIDVYENSFSLDCPFPLPTSVAQTQQNTNDSSCETVSAPDITPAIHTTFHQAQHFCAVRGGRLPSTDEWYDAALGTPDSSDCNLNGSLAKTATYPECNSARGVVDMIGNVWEWVDGDVSGGTFNNRNVPPTGFVSEADQAGIAVKTTTTAQTLFNHDYFWSKTDGQMMMVRGGFFNSDTDGGLFSVHADLTPSFASAAIGFRCVIDR